ncbi:L-Ala-D/L-amino acid epimerase [Capsicum annuum]|nr:L-Ala-D/L-amino acid epimerase [Capsicum annuum]
MWEEVSETIPSKITFYDHTIMPRVHTDQDRGRSIPQSEESKAWQRTGVNSIPVTFRSGNATVPVGIGISVPNDAESGTDHETLSRRYDNFEEDLPKKDDIEEQDLGETPTPTSLITELPKDDDVGPKNPMKITASMAVAPTCFGFKNLMETVTIDVHKAEGRPLNVPLIAPFTIASSRLDKVENVAIRVELSNGCVGWGEAPILPFVTAEDQETALAKAAEACEFLKQSRQMTLNLVLAKIGDVLPGHDFASVRAGVEMALIDAAANSIGIPLWRIFDAVSNSISTDITVKNFSLILL